jgi:hypothetical protein
MLPGRVDRIGRAQVLAFTGHLQTASVDLELPTLLLCSNGGICPIAAIA